MDRKPDAEVAFFIELANLCELMHTTPSGVMNEDSYLMEGVLKVYRARAERKNVKGDK